MGSVYQYNQVKINDDGTVEVVTVPAPKKNIKNSVVPRKQHVINPYDSPEYQKHIMYSPVTVEHFSPASTASISPVDLVPSLTPVKLDTSALSISPSPALAKGEFTAPSPYLTPSPQSSTSSTRGPSFLLPKTYIPQTPQQHAPSGPKGLASLISSKISESSPSQAHFQSPFISTQNSMPSNTDVLKQKILTPFAEKCMTIMACIFNTTYKLLYSSNYDMTTHKDMYNANLTQVGLNGFQISQYFTFDDLYNVTIIKRLPMRALIDEKLPQAWRYIDDKMSSTITFLRLQEIEKIVCI